jgi:FkbM family methyltransferase
MNKRIEVDGLLFEVRRNSSDEKAIKEVVTNKGYQRKFFQVEAGEHWLDLGANIGAFSCWASRLGAAVTAYEPEPANARLTRANLELNGFQAQVIEAAVVADTETRDSIRLYTSENAYWRHSIYKPGKRQYVDVPAARISNLLPGVDAVKMDIEGAEIDLLFALRDFQAVKKLVFEYHFDVNRSVALFMEIMGRLKHHFKNVHHRNYPPHVTEHAFFPYATTVFCYQ